MPTLLGIAPRGAVVVKIAAFCVGGRVVLVESGGTVLVVVVVLEPRLLPAFFFALAVGVVNGAALCLVVFPAFSLTRLDDELLVLISLLF